jgi:sulfhydrogenase subunit beta (sulfur reductase)
MYKLQAQELPKLYAALAEMSHLYVPVLQDGKTDFALWTKEAQIDLETVPTAKSMKNVIFPQVEKLMDFDRDGKKLSVTARPLPTDAVTVFGVRACDVQGLVVLDKVFLKDPVDTFYKARRDNSVLIGLACSRPAETCFCTAVGHEPGVPGADVDTWLIDGTLYWEAKTEKGKALTAKLTGKVSEGTNAGEAKGAVNVAALFAPASAQDAQLVQDAIAKVKKLLEQLPLGKFKFNPGLYKDESKAFNSKIWEQLAPTCLSCCGCTYVCPTCHCYDVRDYDAKGHVERYRCWDSCMHSDFTKMAHGNPRKGRMERFRQRYMHKLVYFPEDYEGVFACTGCGRCLRICPVNLNIVKVAKALEVDLHV